MFNAIKHSLGRIKRQVFSTRSSAAETSAPASGDGITGPVPGPREASRWSRSVPLLTGLLVVGGVLGGAGYLFVHHQPVRGIPSGDMGLRTNQLTGAQELVSEGQVWVVPGLHTLRVVSLRDQSWTPRDMVSAEGTAPVQSVEGLSLGIDLVVRYAIDPKRVTLVMGRAPSDVGRELVDPALQGVVYKTFARYTVREIFSSKRAEIQQALEAELKPRLAEEGVLLRTVQVGKIDLPASYSERMETLLAEELASEKMRFTLELKEKQVKESELQARAEMVQRELQAEAEGKVQVIAAKAQEEAMKHVLPFKERQVEQRRLEAEAEKQSRIRLAQGSAEARKIEADGEALARQRLAEAEAFRVEHVGLANAGQMAREGNLLSRYPLLIQKVMADKLSDKVQVIIAAPPADGGFIGANLLGQGKPGAHAEAVYDAADASATQ